jgi:hypothetical protein
LAEGTKAQMEEYQTGAVNATTSADIWSQTVSTVEKLACVLGLRHAIHANTFHVFFHHSYLFLHVGYNLLHKTKNEQLHSHLRLCSLSLLEPK